MARSGLERVGLSNRIAHDFSPREMLPAVGQGIVAVECAASDWQTRKILSLIDDASAHLSCDAEREVLWVLNGHCNSPISGYSTIDGAQMTLTAAVLDEDGGAFIEVTRAGPADRPRELGRAVGLELLAKDAAAIIARTPVVTTRHPPYFCSCSKTLYRITWYASASVYNSALHSAQISTLL